MKKTLLLTLSMVLLGAVTAFGQIRAGAALGYGTEIENFGFGVNGEYFITDEIAGAASFIYWLTDDAGPVSTSMWEINVNAHYYFLIGDVSAYGIGGLNYTTVDAEVDLGPFGKTSASNSEVGLNVGVGGTYDLGSSMLPFAEAKYVLGNADQLSIMAGVRFTF